MQKAPNQIIKTEVILGGISTAMAKISARLYKEENSQNPNNALIERDEKKLTEFGDMRQNFYRSGDASDEEYYRLIKVIRNELKYGEED